jgi:nucleoside-diphosphate-sugar epimerase
MTQPDPTADLATPKSSLIVVTGANSFIGSHICAEFLALGYKVRGTVRNSDKTQTDQGSLRFSRS